MGMGQTLSWSSHPPLAQLRTGVPNTHMILFRKMTSPLSNSRGPESLHYDLSPSLPYQVFSVLRVAEELALDPESSPVLLPEWPAYPERAGWTQCLGLRPPSRAKPNNLLGFLPCASVLLGKRGDQQAKGMLFCLGWGTQNPVLPVSKEVIFKAQA